jgi:hypothetical protein
MKSCDLKYSIHAYTLFGTESIVFNFGMMFGSMLIAKFYSEFWWNTPLWMRVIRTIIAEIFSIGIIIGLD